MDSLLDDRPADSYVQHIVVDRGDAPREMMLSLVPQMSVRALHEHSLRCPERVEKWLSGPFAKIVRVAEKPHRMVDPDFDVVHVETPGLSIAVYPPMAKGEMPRFVKRARLDNFASSSPGLQPVPDRGMQEPVIFVDGGLGLSTGKVCAQASHAAMALYLGEEVECADVIEVSGEDFARLQGMDPSVVIADAGRTETVPGTVTALAFRSW